MAELPRGTRIGGYTIRSLLGKGGMGTVYEAEDAKRQRTVALKVVSRELSLDPDFMSRFRREGRAQSVVLHENVVAFLDAGEEGGTPYLVFEHVPGGTLESKLRQAGRLGWPEACSIAAKIARGLEAIHSAGFIHRDLKPENVLLAPSAGSDEIPKIADFGLVGASTASLAMSRALTRTGEMVGTLAYMAPEQANAQNAVTRKADLYSLGALLYRVITGEPPFEGAGYGLAMKHMVEKPRPPRELVPGIPQALDRLVLTLLAKRPDERPASAHAVARELEALVRHGEREGNGPGPRGGGRWKVGVAGAVLVVALGLAVLVPALQHESKVAEARTLAEEASALLEKKDRQKAIEAAGRALELDPDLASAWFARGAARAEALEDDLAIPDLDRAIELEPTMARAFAYRGTSRRRRGDVRGALADLDRAIEIDPTIALAWSERASLERLRGDLDGAISDLTRAIALEPRTARLYQARAETRVARGDLEGAIADLTKALELAPKEASIWVDRGSCFARKGDLERAIGDFGKAIELDPRNTLAYTNRAGARQNLGKIEEALADLAKAIELDPRNAIAWDFQGLAHASRGEVELAITDFDKAVQLEPTNAPAWLHRGLALVSLGNDDEAIASYTHAIEIDPGQAEPFFRRASARKRKGDHALAVADWSKVIELTPKSPVPWMNRAFCREKLGDIEGAISDLERFLVLAPDDPNAPAARSGIQQMKRSH